VVANESFAVVLRRYRRAAGLTQESLAWEAGLSATGVAALGPGVGRCLDPGR
jgi:DNA-binding XRE family transcriptional regulator